jgi:nucleoside-diphosphate-sugar epimerase
MRILVTGASGWIGSASVSELLASGHDVLGLARSDAAAATIAGLGAEPVAGSLEDLQGLRRITARVEGVVHLGYVHDFSRMEFAAQTDRAAIEVFAEGLAGTGGPLLIASGTLGLATGRLGTELDRPDPALHPRLRNAAYTLDLASRNVRSMVVRFAPTVHGGGGDHGFMAVLSRIARERGLSAYVGEGLNRWSAVHRLDAAKLVQLAVDKAPADSVWHAVAEEGIATRDIAQALGQYHHLPVAGIPADQARAHFDWIGLFFGMDAPASNAMTRDRLGWAPSHPSLMEDISAGHYPGH